MRRLRQNEKIVKEYNTFIVVEVICPEERKYRTTIDKWTPKNKFKIRIGHHKINGSF